jgi:hypothetical protein
VNICIRLLTVGVLATLSLLASLSYSVPAFSSDNKGEEVSGVAKQQSAGGVNTPGSLAQSATGGAQIGDAPDQFDCQSGNPELSHPGSCSEFEKSHGRGVSETARGDEREEEPPCDPEEEDCETDGED